MRRGVIITAMYEKRFTPHLHLAEAYGASKDISRQRKQPAKVRPGYARGAGDTVQYTPT